jgi:hypothetical protein
MTDPRWQTLPEATRIRWIRVLDDYTPIALTPLSRIALRTLAVQGNADGLTPPPRHPQGRQVKALPWSVKLQCGCGKAEASRVR